MYLLDTDILSNLLTRTPSTSLIAKLATLPPEQQFTSSITYGELVYGALWLDARGDALLERMERALLPNLPTLPFDTEAARQYGSMRADLERRGTPIGDADIRIAADCAGLRLHSRDWKRSPLPESPRPVSRELVGGISIRQVKVAKPPHDIPDRPQPWGDRFASHVSVRSDKSREIRTTP